MEVAVFISMARALTSVAAISAFAACAANQQYGSSSAASGTVALSAYPAAPLDASETRMLGGLSDADIVGHLLTVDSMEVATADTTLRLSKSDDVLTYARLMHAAHTAHLQSDRDLAQRAGITPTSIFGGLRASHVAASLDSVRIASDATIDRHYVMSQVQLHEHVLAELETLEKVAKNDAVRQQVEAMIPMVRDHLSRAHALAVDKGYEKKRT